MAIKRMVSIGEMARFRKRSFEEEADHLHRKCIKASCEALAILKAYPNGGMPAEEWENYSKLLVEQLEYARMHIFFQEELEKMGAF